MVQILSKISLLTKSVGFQLKIEMLSIEPIIYSILIDCLPSLFTDGPAFKRDRCLQFKTQIDRLQLSGQDCRDQHAQELLSRATGGTKVQCGILRHERLRPEKGCAHRSRFARLSGYSQRLLAVCRKTVQGVRHSVRGTKLAGWVKLYLAILN